MLTDHAPQVFVRGLIYPLLLLIDRQKVSIQVKLRLAFMNLSISDIIGYFGTKRTPQNAMAV